jgi:nucleotide-binding universal stress UspA family protein
MFQQILVPLDRSARAEQAIPVAARIARASGGSILLLQVVTTPIDYAPYLSQTSVLMREKLEADHNAALYYLASITYSKDLAGVEKNVEVLSGDPAESILSLVHTRRFDLIVMCSHGPAALKRWRPGRVAQKVARHSPIPVLVLREGGIAPAPTQAKAARPIRALIGLDGSALAEEALAPAAHLVAALSAPAHGALHLLQVISIPAVGSRLRHKAFLSSGRVEQAQQAAEAYLNTVADRLRKGEFADLKLSITSSVAIAVDVADTIIRLAEHREGAIGMHFMEGFDLIAIATHGRGGVQRWVMGSVTDRIFGATKLPLLIVRPPRQRGEIKQEMDKGATITTRME